MVKVGNAGASAPKLSNERCRAILSDPASDPEKARLAQEVIDLRTSTGFLEAKVDEQSAEVARLTRALARVKADRATIATLLEQAQTELADARAKGAA